MAAVIQKEQRQPCFYKQKLSLEYKYYTDVNNQGNQNYSVQEHTAKQHKQLVIFINQVNHFAFRHFPAPLCIFWSILIKRRIQAQGLGKIINL